MTAFDGTQVRIGPGTLYAAPIGTTEPTALTGAWPANWVELGYTDAGSTFSLNPTVSDVDVAEEFWPVATEITAYAASLTFALAQPTAQNLQLALNAGIGSSLLAATHGSTSDGGTWVEPPDLGAEVTVMLGWDALPKGATSGSTYGRLIVRRALQVGNVQIQAQKAPNKRLYAAEFRALKPASAQPFRFLFDSSMAA